MGSIPFGGIAALANQTGQIAQAPLNSLEEQARIKQTQTETQGLALQNQLQQQAIRDQGALTKALSQYDPTTMGPADITRLVTQNGGSGKAALEAQTGLINAKQNLLKLSDTEFQRQQQQNDLIAGVHKQVSDAPAEQKQQVYTQGLQSLQQAGIDVSKEPPQYPGDPVFAQHLIPIQLQTKLLDQAEKERTTQAEAAANNAKAANENAQAGLNQLKLNLAKNATPGSFDQQIDSIYPPNDPNAAGQNRMLKTLLNSALSRGDLDSANKYVSQALENQQSLAKEISVQTNPRIQAGKVAVATAEGQARANIEAAMARGANAALANVPPHLIPQATTAATKAGEDYAQAQSVNQRLQEMMDAAKRGNVVSYQLIPQEGALQVTTSQGVHRINLAEIQNYGGGSLWQRMQGHIGKELTGESIPDSVLNDMAEMQRIQEQGARQKYENELKTVNNNYGSSFKPVDMPTKAEGGTGGGKSLPITAIQQAAKDHGVSVDEAKRQAIAAGYTISGQ